MAAAVTGPAMARGAVIRLAPTAEALAQAAASEVLALLEAAMAWRGEAHLALAGGRTPAALYRMLAAMPFDGWSHVHVWFGDERTVPPDHADSNYRMAQETLLGAVAIPPAHVHRMQGEAEPNAAAVAYDEALAALAVRQERSVPAFDVLLLGMGADAHTASLFPGSPLLGDQARGSGVGSGDSGAESRESGGETRESGFGIRDSGVGSGESGVGRFAAAVHVPALDTWRLTITPVTIRAARTAFVLVAGADKHAALRRVLGASPSLSDAPVTLLHELTGDVAWFVDRAALFGDPTHTP